jgi:hypothetical protein
MAALLAGALFVALIGFAIGRWDGGGREPQSRTNRCVVFIPPGNAPTLPGGPDDYASTDLSACANR